MSFARRNEAKSGVTLFSAMMGLLAFLALLALVGCGHSVPNASRSSRLSPSTSLSSSLSSFSSSSLSSSGLSTDPDRTPPRVSAARKPLNTAKLIEMAAANPLFNISDQRGLHHGTLALTAGRTVSSRLPVCPSAIPGPLARCIPRGAKIVNGRLSFGVAEFGGETGLYFIDGLSVCFSRMTTIVGCHRLSLHPEGRLVALSDRGRERLWIRL